MGVQPVLELHGISKAFGGQIVLEDVSLSLLGGEIHGLLGQNGSGKSTLLKILSGYHHPEPGGRIDVNGHRLALPVRSSEARQIGLSFVHQDLGLIPSLTVLDNLCLRETVLEPSWRIDWGVVRREASALLDAYGLKVDLDLPVQALTPVQRAMLAVVRAMDEQRSFACDSGSKVLVLDETTAFLPLRQRQHLFGLLRDVADKGHGVLMVSHDISEVLEHTDRVTVLRDGRVAAALDTKGLREDDLVELIVGRRVSRSKTTAEGGSSELVQVTLGDAAAPVLKVRIGKGEIVGITGLAGSGYSDLPYAIFGAAPDRGAIRIGDDFMRLECMTPQKAIDLGIGLVPSDRLGSGAVGSLTVEENVTLQILDRLSGFLGLSRSAAAQEASRLIDHVLVQPKDPANELGRLSGGNQQKVIFAKWSAVNPRLLLLDEPTLGIDVGAREQIYQLIRDAAEAGTGILCSSTDYEQLAALCHRVYVYRNGLIVAELTDAELDKGNIAAHCYATIDEER